jgi:hypothetical protein
VNLVVFVDGGDHEVRPLFGDLRLRTVALVETQVLDELVIAHPAGVPALFALAAGNRFIHQIIAEYGGAFGAGFGNSFPEARLGDPTVFVRQRIVPWARCLM